MAFTPKVKKVITLPMVKLQKDTPIYCRVDAPFFTGKAIDDKKEVATLCNITLLETGECAQIIVPSVLKSTFSESYPKDSYVGLCFAICKTSNAGDGGKAYAKFSLSEIEDPAAPTDAAPAKKAAK